MDVLVINGPNLNTLGTREPEVYWPVTLPEIEAALIAEGAATGLSVDTCPRHHEGAISDRLNDARAGGTNEVALGVGRGRGRGQCLERTEASRRSRRHDPATDRGLETL